MTRGPRHNDGYKTEPSMTPRRFEVLLLISEGLSTREIATRLEVSEKTAETHRTILMRIAKVHNMMHLVRWGMRNKYISIKSMLRP